MRLFSKKIINFAENSKKINKTTNERSKKAINPAVKRRRI